MDLERKENVAMKENMRFACMIHKGCSVIKERAIPELAPNEVLVKNIACNIWTVDGTSRTSGISDGRRA